MTKKIPLNGGKGECFREMQAMMMVPLTCVGKAPSTWYYLLFSPPPPSFPLFQQAARCACQLQLPVAKNSEVKAA